MKDIFTGNTLTVEVDGKEVKEITQWANPLPQYPLMVLSVLN